MNPITRDRSKKFLEEREEVPLEDPALNAMFVHSGLYIDDVVQMRRWNELEEAFEDFYYHCDDLSSVRALTDEDGELVELYDYHEYGLPTITDPNTIVSGRPALLASSAFGNLFLFTGQMYDHETRLYHYRTRPYEPRMGDPPPVVVPVANSVIPRSFSAAEAG